MCTGVFGKGDINRIEREFLDVLDYELNFQEADLLLHHSAIVSLLQTHHYHERRHRRTLIVRAPTRSRWNDSESEYDASSSRSISPMPVTPEVEFYELPVSVGSSVSSKTEVDVITSQPHHYYHRFSSSLSILKAFPMPYFRKHHHRNQHRNEQLTSVKSSPSPSTGTRAHSHTVATASS
jgi:hypothetical protein